MLMQASNSDANVGWEMYRYVVLRLGGTFGPGTLYLVMDEVGAVQGEYRSGE
jgi:hypothetical protein